MAKLLGKTLSPSSDSTLETFAFMLVEEFLMKKDMHETLDVFRSEWKRPAEVRVTYFIEFS